MRHNKNFNHLGRQTAHRKAMLANMATSLMIHKRITTTEAKAKALKRYAEPVITKAKNDTTHSRRIAFSYLRDKHAVTELFRVIAPAVGERPGGYTRILKTGFRKGDAADMCIIELVDFNETYGKEAPAAGKARTRRSRAGSGATKSAEGETAQAEGAEATEAKAEKKAPAKKAAPKATQAVQKNQPARTSGAKTVARKTAASKKS
ncbi:50S ribosomal protein L17 [Alistipes sp. OttesenSCG-928-B03]|nr:50S ribosomal protein L17 [Alistipes sp. OttesenSCG-928-B03]